MSANSTTLEQIQGRLTYPDCTVHRRWTLYGERGGNRTHNLMVKSHLLFLLSYAPVIAASVFPVRRSEITRRDSNPDLWHYSARWTVSGILLSTIIRLAPTLPPESLPDTRGLPGTIIIPCFRLLHLRCRPFHPDLTGSSLLPSLTFRWKGVTLQAVPCSPDFPLRRAIVRPSCYVLLFSSSNRVV